MILLSNKVYDILKWIALYLLPGISTLYFALSKIWGLPYGVEVVGTLTATVAFIATLLGISTASYNKLDHSDGVLEIDTTSDSKDIYRLYLNTDLDTLGDKSEVTLRINPDADLSQD